MNIIIGKIEFLKIKKIMSTILGMLLTEVREYGVKSTRVYKSKATWSKQDVISQLQVFLIEYHVGAKIW